MSTMDSTARLFTRTSSSVTWNLLQYSEGFYASIVITLADNLEVYSFPDGPQ